MRLTSLTLKDFRGFTDATLNLDRPLTVLCGVNGAGKSSALLACLMVLSDILRMQRAANVWVHFLDDTDVRVGAKKLSITASFVSGTISREVSIEHERGASHGPNTHGANLEREGPPLLAVYYGASREVESVKSALTPSGATAEKSTAASTFTATEDALVVGQLKFESLFRWFKAREDVENELKVSRQDLSLSDPQLEAVRRAVSLMLPGFSGLRIQRDPLHLVVHKAGVPLVLDQLSDGERLLLALTADLARRLAMVTPNGSDPLLGEAVVLIDEVELHLHPAWQRRVLADLRRTFPNCQLIVTTHSPQVLSETVTEAVTVVEDFQFYGPDAPTHGRDTNSILTEVLGAPERPTEFRDKLDAISNLIDEDRFAEAHEGLDEVAEIVTERDPEVTRLRTMLDVVERLDAHDRKGS